MKRRRWRAKRARKTIVLLAIGVVAVGSLTPASWRGAKDMMARHAGTAREVVQPAVTHAIQWLDRHTCALRDWLGPMEVDPCAAAVSRDETGVRFPRGPAPLSGFARVVDGDTLDVAGVRVRLHGIDAPESAQRCRAAGRFWSCGREAARRLARRIGNQSIACKERDRDRYARVVAVCSIGDLDLNEWMVAEGWAFAYWRYSLSYILEELRARSGKRGVWRGEVVPPWKWRKGTRLERS